MDQRHHQHQAPATSRPQATYGLRLRSAASATTISDQGGIFDCDQRHQPQQLATREGSSTATSHLRLRSVTATNNLRLQSANPKLQLATTTSDLRL
ncbi:unnamed protein product [Ilex paraguariensis]|uniref:Uncharacterized protein n=1 Tax=Ilex paraguariensis TaxID=185542 RepID=A0ABC8SQ29_9AQUA